MEKRRAEDVIDHLSGVKHVQNNLRVQDTRSGSSFATGTNGGYGSGSSSSGAGSSGSSGLTGSSSGSTAARPTSAVSRKPPT
jgi:hypothetical protein